jgi:hypothetical protein
MRDGCHPVTGGGFRVTFLADSGRITCFAVQIWKRLTKPHATHSIYFDALSEHGWVGIVLVRDDTRLFVDELLMVGAPFPPAT